MRLSLIRIGSRVQFGRRSLIRLMSFHCLLMGARTGMTADFRGVIYLSIVSGYVGDVGRRMGVMVSYRAAATSVSAVYISQCACHNGHHPRFSQSLVLSADSRSKTRLRQAREDISHCVTRNSVFCCEALPCYVH